MNSQLFILPATLKNSVLAEKKATVEKMGINTHKKIKIRKQVK
jgi:hypothetical protein